LRAELAKQQPDILHTWLFAANAYGRLLCPRSANAKPYRVVSERCVDSWKSGWQLWLDRKLIGRTDRLIGNSNAVRAFYADVGYSDKQLTVIPNAVEAPPQPTEDRPAFLKQLQLPDDARLVMHVGRLAKQKRVDDLLWGAQLLRQADERAYFVIVGDGPERDRLIHRAEELEVAKHVRFLGHREDAASLLHYADVYWLGSDFEGMSNSLMEAMACGKPSVVSDIPPNRELIEHSKEGYISAISDGAGFAQFSLKLFNDAELSRTMGEAAGRRMRDEFSVERMIGRYAELYRELCNVETGEIAKARK